MSGVSLWKTAGVATTHDCIQSRIRPTAAYLVLATPPEQDSFRAFQASARGGIVHVRVTGERAISGGKAVTIVRGELLAEPS